MDLGQIIAFSVVVICTYFIEGLIGFGGTIMCFMGNIKCNYAFYKYF